MSDAQTSTSMSPKLLRVVERARSDPRAKFNSLAHLIDEPALHRAYRRLRKGAAAGVDEITKEEYGQDLEDNLGDLHRRMRSNRYRHRPIRRVFIPKGDGRTRPIGISTLEDKLVQGAVREVLEAVYEQDFLDCSYGFRPSRGAHDAVLAINQVARRAEANWIYEADIVSFFDSIDRSKLMEMLGERVVDGALRRLVGKCLNAGVLDGDVETRTHEGTAQGSALSPLLGNLYLHCVLDRWFEQEVRPRLRGRASLVRYADDFIVCFEREGDAKRFAVVVPKRMGRFGLALHPDKTRLLRFGPRPRAKRRRSGTFDFLGFTFHWTRSRRGRWFMLCRTQKSRFRRALRSISDWCRRHRHWAVANQHEALTRRVRGFLTYYGVSGNFRVLASFIQRVQEIWRKWLRRRSQRTRLTWKRWAELRVRFPLPRPRIAVRFW